MAEKKKPFVMLDIKNETDRQKALETAITNMEKDFGKGAVMKLGDVTKRENVPVIPTGSLSLDIALGIGGVPRGRIIEIYGPESSGKTTVALHMVAECQKLGGICGYVDAEHAMDPLYAKNLGVNIDELYISQPDSGEQALEIAEAMVRSCVIDLIIIDSVAALTPRAEIEGDMGDSHMGLQARLMSQALRKLTAVCNKTNCTILFINQLREKIGGAPSYGGPSETTTGGRALRFYASVRLDIRRIGSVKQGEAFLGNETRVKVAKNKMAPPFKSAVFDIMYGKGVSREGDILEMAIALKMANKSGAWYSYNDIRLGQGKENARQYLTDHPETMKELESAIRKHYEISEITSLEPTPEEPAKKSPKKKEAKEETASKEETTSEAVKDPASEDYDIDMEELLFEEE